MVLDVLLLGIGIAIGLLVSPSLVSDRSFKAKIEEEVSLIKERLSDVETGLETRRIHDVD